MQYYSTQFEKNEVLEDIKHAFRQKQIENEGNNEEIEMKKVEFSKLENFVRFKTIQRKGNFPDTIKFSIPNHNKEEERVSVNDVKVNEMNIDSPHILLENSGTKLVHSKDDNTSIFYEMEIFNKNSVEFELEKYLTEMEKFYKERRNRKIYSPIFKLNSVDELIFNELSKNFDQLFSIENVLKTQIELNKLKKVLFNEDQEMMFSNFYFNFYDSVSSV